jgi:hypothetical protein
VLKEPDQRPQRLGLITARLKRSEAMAISARQLAEHEPVELIRLPTRGAKPIARRLDLVGCSASTRTPASNSRSTNRPSGRSIATTSTSKQTSAAHSALTPSSSCASVAASNSSPAGSSISTSCFSDAHSSAAQFTHHYPPGPDSSTPPDPEVPLRVLMDEALTRGYVLSPLAAPHDRRDGLVFHRPSDQRKRSRPSPGGGRGKHKLALSDRADRVSRTLETGRTRKRRRASSTLAERQGERCARSNGG